MTDFQGLIALVTGGASGIGAATARLLHARGARLQSWSAAPKPRVMACWPYAATSRIPQRSTPRSPRSSSGWMALMSW
jgi:NAD(P)-dependent dehydrogenase (short-subunit alcohol dehydrogenase family)